MAKAAPLPIIPGPSIKGATVPAAVRETKPLRWTVDCETRERIDAVRALLVDMTDEYLDTTPIEMRRALGRMTLEIDSISERLTAYADKRRMKEVRFFVYGNYVIFDKVGLHYIVETLMRCALYLAPMPAVAAHAQDDRA